MSVSSRVQCAVIAVALLPYAALAQSSPLGSINSPASGAQLSATPIVAPVSPIAQPADNDIAGAATVIPAPNLEADPIPTDASAPVASSESAELETAGTGPSAASATSGIHSLAASEHLTAMQLADRANHRDQDGGDNRGLGRDAVLMIIGGAAIVAGAIVGGGGGTALIVVGAVIGVTGLVLILSR